LPGDNFDTGWEPDEGDRGNKAMPNRYLIQNDLANHEIKDDPGKPYIIQFEKNRPEVRKGNTAIFTLVQLPSDTKKLLKQAAKIVQRVSTLQFKYQTYLVKTAGNKPLGFVTWGFTVRVDKDGPRVTDIVQPDWNKDTDPNVWGK
jgi:hypothetical protein